MRIVGGKFKGRRLSGPAGQDIRPTSDRAREALFNILSHGGYAGPDGPMPQGMAVLDVFAGTGALGLEALSRGAASVCFIEKNRAAARAIEAAVEEIGESARAEILTRDATQPGAASNAFNLVLMDAPYRTGQSEPSLAALAELGWLCPGAICCVELAKKESFEPGPGFTRLDERTYGAARMVILQFGD
ncbi:MAG: 16S rRNA (guanine(966)-N(2))-methyltransferase RsmD [Alphaproteobacteria bacterium]|jgi:16S rRNA (guanine966-N2)-methyltransferase|nr:16S rRNA (guanine(966)-N(2))-methyltransferase RsmD [Alphaproteobacteria bacterium]MDP6829471.1 16S rRNA (guanine(966)-N(2))-methyltransferase RsmD [Alphaproteobacteria bacterium]MDP6872166.1 16S rRNA (guanine(966)-N(2))-methyltransferase RsmD [Alphaproteobacteria bacterium]